MATFDDYGLSHGIPDWIRHDALTPMFETVEWTEKRGKEISSYGTNNLSFTGDDGSVASYTSSSKLVDDYWYTTGMRFNISGIDKTNYSYNYSYNPSTEYGSFSLNYSQGKNSIAKDDDVTYSISARLAPTSMTSGFKYTDGTGNSLTANISAKYQQISGGQEVQLKISGYAFTDSSGRSVKLSNGTFSATYTEDETIVDLTYAFSSGSVIASNFKMTSGAGKYTLEDQSEYEQYVGLANSSESIDFNTYLDDWIADFLLSDKSPYLATSNTVSITSTTGQWFDTAAGNDKLIGNNGDDSLYGGTGNDMVSGLDGDDLLAGESGKDTLVGGKGNDIFYFGDLAQLASNDADTISDFKTTAKPDTDGSTDSLWFDGSSSVNTEFAIVRKITDKETIDGEVIDGQGIIYEQTTGKLYYDEDGAGIGKAGILIVTLTGRPALSSVDIEIY